MTVLLMILWDPFFLCLCSFEGSKTLVMQLLQALDRVPSLGEADVSLLGVIDLFSADRCAEESGESCSRGIDRRSVSYNRNSHNAGCGAVK
jgi:hypothetical protein